MNTERAMHIKSSLEGLGTDPTKGYTHKEIIDKLIELENALLSAVYEKNHAENMRPQDLTKHFSTLAEEFGLNNSEVYKRFVANMDELDHTVKSLIAGQRGERIARSSLKPLTYNGDIKILYNVQLEDEVMKTEYDAIVIAPYGLFVVEVKNWPGRVTLTSDGFLTRDGSSVISNLAARMIVKESLLKECLGDLFPKRYSGILLFPEEKTMLKDEYHQIPFSYGISIINSIKQYSNGSVVLSPAQIEAVSELITNSNKNQYTYCDVKCSEIIEDFATLMSQIESASNNEEDESIGITLQASVELPPEVDTLVEKGRDFVRNIRWKRNAKVITGIAASLVLGFAVGSVCKKH